MNQQDTKRTADELDKQLREAERRYREAASGDAFIASCHKLRQAVAAYRRADEKVSRLQEEEQALIRAQETSGNLDVLERARRASQGIPRLDDLRLVLFPGKGKSQAEPYAPEVAAVKEQLRLAESEAEETHNAVLIAFDEFGERYQEVKEAAERFVSVRQAVTGTAACEHSTIEDEALAELSSLPVLEGLEEFYFPR